MQVILKGVTNGYKLEETDAVLVISIDPYYDSVKSKASPFEGEQFDAICAELSEKFKTVTIIVTDTLQRYNLMLDGMSEIEAENFAREKGTEWLKRNDPRSKLANLADIIRWDHFIKSEEYLQKVKPMFDTLYSEIDACSRAISHSAGEFVKRRASKEIAKKGKSGFTEEEKIRAIEFSKVYAKEESAVVALWEEYNWQFLLYPGSKLNQGIYYALKRFIQNKDPHKLLHLEVAFKTEKKTNLSRNTENTKLPSINFLFNSSPMFTPNKMARGSGNDRNVSIRRLTTLLAHSIEQQIAVFIELANIEVNPELTLQDLFEELAKHRDTNAIEMEPARNNNSITYNDKTIHSPDSPPKANC